MVCPIASLENVVFSLCILPGAGGWHPHCGLIIGEHSLFLDGLQEARKYGHVQERPWGGALCFTWNLTLPCKLLVSLALVASKQPGSIAFAASTSYEGEEQLEYQGEVPCKT